MIEYAFSMPLYVTRALFTGCSIRVKVSPYVNTDRTHWLLTFLLRHTPTLDLKTLLIYRMRPTTFLDSYVDYHDLYEFHAPRICRNLLVERTNYSHICFRS